MASKGNANKDTLDDRMKRYEAVTTSYSLIERLPVYARIDGRAFHTYTRGLKTPFDPDFTEVMQKTTAYLVDKTNAMLGYCMSDEISLCWLEPSKVPFETRLFKLESVLAGMASTAFTLYSLETSLKDKTKKMFPHFDCRVCQLPDLNELANMFLFRERDCIKNAITMAALSKLSHAALQHKNSTDKIKMLKHAGIIYEKDIPEHLRVGSYFHRMLCIKTLTEKELAKVPEKQRKLDRNGEMHVLRSKVVQFSLGHKLEDIKDKVFALFGDAAQKR